MSDPVEIYRDPTRDSALLDLSPHLRLSVPMYLFAKYGPLHANWEELDKKIKEVYSTLSLGAPGNKTSLAEALGLNEDA